MVELTNDMVLKLKLLGNCEDCPMSEMTMTAGVEETIRKAILKFYVWKQFNICKAKVICNNDHADFLGGSGHSNV